MSIGSEPDARQLPPPKAAPVGHERVNPATSPERSRTSLLWYRLVQQFFLQVFAPVGVRATGREHVPPSGGALLVSNHLSHLDVIVLGLLLPRPLTYVARSTLFTPWLGPIIRSIGGFPIQRDGVGVQGMKETLKRVRSGSIVTFFPEGTRSDDGQLGPLRPGIAALASRAGVPIVPAGIAGTFEAWPRSRRLPRPHPIHVHYGPPILPADLADQDADQVVGFLAQRLEDARAVANQELSRLMALPDIREVPA